MPRRRIGRISPGYPPAMPDPSATLDLLDYRRAVAELYRRARDEGSGAPPWSRWRTARDALFATHPQSPLSESAQDHFQGLPFFPYDPGWRIVAPVEPVPRQDVEVGHSGEGATGFQRFGHVHLSLPTGEATLNLYGLAGYGGGVFLPFRDATSGTDTYGGGRYLLDSVKGADLGHEGHDIVLDFNYSYHPSCVHDARWSCPLAPPENWLDLEIRAGERL